MIKQLIRSEIILAGIQRILSRVIFIFTIIRNAHITRLIRIFTVSIDMWSNPSLSIMTDTLNQIEDRVYLWISALPIISKSKLEIIEIIEIIKNFDNIYRIKSNCNRTWIVLITTKTYISTVCRTHQWGINEWISSK